MFRCLFTVNKWKNMYTCGDFALYEFVKDPIQIE